MEENIKPKLIVRKGFISKDLDVNALLPEIIAQRNTDPIQIVEVPATNTNPWDVAHAAKETNMAYSFAEPEVESAAAFYSQPNFDEKGEITEETYYSFLEHWPHPEEPSIWHLGSDYSQLKPAKDAVAKLPSKRVVRIAHFDTGYDKNHISFPSKLIRYDLARNFVDDEMENWNNAEDNFSNGLLNMPGHGTGTLSILAGIKNKINQYTFDDYIGLYDSIEIVPVRIAKSVVLFKSGAFVRALDYVVNELYKNDANRVHVITMSMGGLASAAWADLINLAYDKGIFMVTAAGNNFKKLPTRTMVYPARFNRVVAACGVTYDFSPYVKPWGEGGLHIMEGNYGPDSLMNTAIAAFTPNVPWAIYRFSEIVGIRGNGTSSATPQIAAAAALYYIKYYDQLEALPEPWMRVEAIRNALFSSARKEINTAGNVYENDILKYYGNGILQANDMLNCPVADAKQLTKQKEDNARFAFFKSIVGLKAMEVELTNDAAEEEMIETELMQLVLTDHEMQQILNNEEKNINDLNREEQKMLASVVIKNPDSSETLKTRMQLLLNQLNLE